MKTKKLFLVVAMFFVTAISALAQREFKHPGGILSGADLERIKTHVNAGDEPWASCWKELQADRLAKSTWTASPSEEIGGGGTRQRAAEDGYAAMLNAIEWHVTGKKAHADCASKILTAWGHKLKTASAELFQYPSRAMIAAAEMLRYSDGTFYEGWAENDRAVFMDKVRTVMYPSCQRFCTYQYSHPSWYTPAALVVLSAGVLLDEPAMYQEGYDLMLNTDHWGTMFGGSIDPSGQMREMGRDNVHGGLTLGDITQACLWAWNQGDDLFAEGDNRLLKGMEYWCRYNTGHTDTPFEPTDCSGLDNATGYSFFYISMHNNGFRLRPDACSFEAVYHHYKEIKGMDAEKEFPYLTIAARLARPDTSNQLLGYGTLFFTIDAAASPYMTEKPQQPKDFIARDGFDCVYLSWKHPENEDSRGFRIYRSTDGTSYSLLTTKDYYTLNEYKDTDVELGATYYYKVQFINKAGYSDMSTVAVATPQEGTDALPKGWGYAGVNSVASGSGLFTEVMDSTFIVNGLGTDIGGSSDMHGFVYKKIVGNGSITARLTSTDESFYKVGIMMRGSLTGNSQRIGLTLGEGGYRMLRMCVRNTTGGGTSWINGTNYGYAPLWMRMTREGDTFTAFVSRDSITWHIIGSTTMTMPKTYYVGLASCNGKGAGGTYQAVFDNVKVTGTVATPTRVPATPAGLKVKLADSLKATLTWRTVADADSFVVYRSFDSENFDSIATVRANHYDDVVALPGTYYYSVAAFNTVGKSQTCTAQEVELYEIKQLKGTIIGTEGSWNNNSSTTKTAAMDGSLSTFFDAKEGSGAWVGYDMGSGKSAVVTYVMFAPRKGYPQRMDGGKFQVATKSDFSDAKIIATVQGNPAEERLTMLAAPSGEAYRYLRYLSPDNGNCNVAEVQFFGRLLDETGTAIDRVVDSVSVGKTYSLDGLEVNNPEKGKIYIQKGKKIVWK